jgi:hypothetical protein
MQPISGVHSVIYSQDADATRAFFRDTLRLNFVDAGHGWLIFALPPAELAIHPTETQAHHELYLMCKNIEAAVDDLKSKGVEFTGEIKELRWGRLATMKIPGAGEMSMYEPRHASPLS